MSRLRYFAFGALCFALCGFGLPGPQGSSGGGSFGGDLAGNTLTDSTSGYVLTDQSIMLGATDLQLERSAEGCLQVSNGTGTTNDGNLYLVSADELDGVYLSATGTAGRLEVGMTQGAGNGSIVAGSLSTSTGNLSLGPASKGLTVAGSAQIYCNLVTLTEATATTALTVALPSDGDYAGGTIFYTIQADDGAGGYELASGNWMFTANNDTGTVTAVSATTTNGSTLNIGSWVGITLSAAVSSTNVLLQINADSSLTTPTVVVRYTAILNTTSSVTLP